MSNSCSGNFSRGFSIIEYLLEDKNHTLKSAAKEFRIAETTARRDMERVAIDALDGKCSNPKETLRMFVKAKKHLGENRKRTN